jgi:hypothetical protein
LPQIARPKLPLAPTLLLGALLLAACGEVVPNAANGPPIPERQVIAQRVDAQGRVIRDRGVLIVETRGTLFQAGVQQGTLLRERLRDQVRDYHERRAFSAFALTPGFVHRIYARQQERHLLPDERDFVRGLAMGSGLGLEELLLLSAEPPYTAFSNQLPTVLPGGGGFIARGQASRDGLALIGRISDDLTFGIRQRSDMLWVHRPDAGPAWVARARVGSLDVEAAWSENGLYASVDPVAGAARTAGLPPRWLTLRLMAAEGPDAAEAELRKVASRTSQAFLATLAQGEQARLVEADGTKVAVRSYGSGGALADTMQSLGEFKARGTAKSAAGPRDERLGKLLAASYGQLDPSRAMELLSDLIDPQTGQRGPVPFSVSRSAPARMAWGPMVLGDWGRLTSSSAMIVQPQEGRLWVALGREQVDGPQQFVDFHFASLLSGDASAQR